MHNSGSKSTISYLDHTNSSNTRAFGDYSACPDSLATIMKNRVIITSAQSETPADTDENDRDYKAPVNSSNVQM